MSGQPVWLLLVLAVIGALSGIGSIIAAVGSRQSKKLGIKANEQKARIDERAAENVLIDQLQEELVRARGQRDAAENKAEIAEAKYDREHEYVEILRRRLWELSDWPPPDRPPKG